VPYSQGTVNLYWLKYAAKFFSVEGMHHLYGTVGKHPCFILVLSSWSDKCFVSDNPVVMACKFYLPL